MFLETDNKAVDRWSNIKVQAVMATGGSGQDVRMDMKRHYLTLTEIVTVYRLFITVYTVFSL